MAVVVHPPEVGEGEEVPIVQGGIQALIQNATVAKVVVIAKAEQTSSRIKIAFMECWTSLLHMHSYDRQKASNISKKSR